MHPILQRKLTEVLDAHRAVRMRYGNAILIILAAAVATALAIAMWKWVDLSEEMWWKMLGAFGLALLAGGLVVRRWSRVNLDLTEVARSIEVKHPELHATLLTAVEQKPGVEGFGYMQIRVIEQAVRDAVAQQWASDLTQRDLDRASWLRAVALVLLAASFGWMSHLHIKGRSHPEVAAVQPEAPKPASQFEVSVTPGDSEVEKGSRLVVEAKFDKDVPPDATLVVTDANGAERARLPMRTTVDTKVFGGLVGNIKEDGLYHVEFAGERSKDFKITTFVHPELESADATITPPSYAKQPVREVKNTLKVTAIEGSKVGWKMKINKPVKDAELYADKDHVVPLKPDAADPTILVADMQPDETMKYRLHLVDDHERSSKQASVISVTVLKNTTPKIEVAFPKRDAKVSTLQELPLEAKLWDDVGVEKAGAVIELDKAKREVPLTLVAPDKKNKIGVKTLMNLEPEKVEPLQLVSYYFWAEDKGPKGESRRTMSDMFFAEVRAFEEIFREQEAPPGEEGGEEKQGAAQELVKLQKDIVNANWRLVRDQNGGRETKAMKGDVDTVMTSQSMNDEKASEALEKVKNAKIKGYIEAAQKEMKAAIGELSKASEQAEPKSVPQALEAEQRALRQLFLAQALEHNVTKSQSNKSQGQQSPQERELMELELKQKEKRYEEDKAASEEKTAEQQENLTVLNRLKELARREEALAEKMKQVEQQLAQAKSEEEKEELANQLKRLQDEQEQLLRDLDELRDRMEKPENAANMADAKKQLDETRDKVNEALQQMKDDKVEQATASASRAQKELEKARDEFRQRTAKRFSEEMKQMRDAARDLAEQEKKLGESLDGQKQPEGSKDASDTTASLRQQLTGAQKAREFDDQKERAKKLMEDMQRISEQAEETEPLLHKHLYEALRSAHMQGLEQHLEEAGRQARYGDRTAAVDAEHKAEKAVEDLKSGVEKAAESVLGNESEALRMARAELDKLIDDARGEARDAREGEANQTADAQQQGGKKGDREKPDGQAKAPGEKGKPGEKGEGKEVAEGGNEHTKGEGDKPGEKGQGEGKEPSETAQNQQGKGKPGEGKEGKEGKEVAQNEKGKGQGKGSPSEKNDGETGEQPGEGKGQQPDKAQQGQGKGKGEVAANEESKGEGKGQGQQPGKSPSGKSGQNGKNQSGQRSAASNANGGDGGNWFFDAPTEVADNSPITGDRFDQWSDRLRNVEEMLTQPSMRNEAAKVLDHARNFRTDARRNNGPPQPGALASRIVKPLVELRDQVTEELARREGRNPLSPVDRDPVPEAYRELVQKYYEQLGTGK